MMALGADSTTRRNRSVSALVAEDEGLGPLVWGLCVVVSYDLNLDYKSTKDFLNDPVCFGAEFLKQSFDFLVTWRRYFILVFEQDESSDDRLLNRRVWTPRQAH